MPALILMVHRVMDEKMIPKWLNVEKKATISLIPMSKKEEHADDAAIIRSDLVKLESVVENLTDKDVKYIFIESNYHFPSEDVIVPGLFEYVLECFPNAMIFAVSTTPSSLIQALNLNSRLLAFHSAIPDQVKSLDILRNCCKEKDMQEPENLEERVLTVPELKALEKNPNALLLTQFRRKSFNIFPEDIENRLSNKLNHSV